MRRALNVRNYCSKNPSVAYCNLAKLALIKNLACEIWPKTHCVHSKTYVKRIACIRNPLEPRMHAAARAFLMPATKCSLVDYCFFFYKGSKLGQGLGGCGIVEDAREKCRFLYKVVSYPVQMCVWIHARYMPDTNTIQTRYKRAHTMIRVDAVGYMPVNT